MGKGFFQFKQFKVVQEGCAMKVTTDACVFGAWLPLPETGHVLDVGTGTGLLALMALQRNPLVAVDALELNAAAAQQAVHNFASSPWAGRVRLHEGPFQGFSPTKRYALVMCNPPFYEKHRDQGMASRAMAMHAESLPAEALVKGAKALLAPGGRLAVMYPAYEGRAFQGLAGQEGFALESVLALQPHPAKPVFRHLMVFGLGKGGVEPVHGLLVVKNEEGQYSPDFRQLLAPFYLHL